MFLTFFVWNILSKNRPKKNLKSYLGPKNSKFQEQKLDEVVPLLLAKPTSQRLMKQVWRESVKMNEVGMEIPLGLPKSSNSGYTPGSSNIAGWSMDPD